jgi:Fe-S cluster assembly protein SufD
MSDIRDWYREQFRAHEARLPAARVSWVVNLRRNALEQFLDRGFPTVKDEEWKYTDLRALASRRLVCVDHAAHPETAEIARFTLDAHELVFVDGHYAPALSLPSTLPEGVTVESLGERLATDPFTLEGLLTRSETGDGVMALNTAFLRDGTYVRLRAGVVVDRPIHLLFVASGLPESAACVRNLIVAGAGSRATVVESYVAVADAGYLTNAVTEVVCEAGSQLDHYRLTDEAESAHHLGATIVHEGRDSRYASHAVSLGGRLARHALTARLEAEDAECLLNGLYLGRGRAHRDNVTRIDHLKPQGKSREWYKGVLDGHARGVFNARVVVHEGACRTDAEQDNRNLLLSPDAEADSRPQLEIYNDDVKCSHGEATGSLDADQLFYLRTRGLDEPFARSLLVYAFAADVLARMRLKPLRARLERGLGHFLGAALDMDKTTLAGSFAEEITP